MKHVIFLTNNVNFKVLMPPVFEAYDKIISYKEFSCYILAYFANIVMPGQAFVEIDVFVEGTEK